MSDENSAALKIYETQLVTVTAKCTHNRNNWHVTECSMLSTVFGTVGGAIPNESSSSSNAVLVNRGKNLSKTTFRKHFKVMVVKSETITLPVFTTVGL